jgi:trehalose-6-phosphatase
VLIGPPNYARTDEFGARKRRNKKARRGWALSRSSMRAASVADQDDTRSMPAAYDTELQALPETYAAAVRGDVGSLRRAVVDAAAGPCLFIGTGGTWAVAQLAARLHERVCAQPAKAVTPLELLQAQPMAVRGAVLFSSGASHPDAEAVMALLGPGSHFRPSVIVTHRAPASDLTDAFGGEVMVVQLPRLDVKEGFLATNSVLAMSVSVLRAYLGDVLPQDLSATQTLPPSDSTRLLVLTGPNLDAAAADIETRCSELGLADVQVADYRNFAHGRHTGLARRSGTTRVIGLAEASTLALADATLACLADASIDVYRWESAAEGLAGVPELIAASARLASRLAAHQGVNPARPGAPKFGRRLYRLSLKSRIQRPTDGPVERKLLALGVGSLGPGPRSSYDRAWTDWSNELQSQVFSGVVLDYDGTVCATEQRLRPPAEDVQQAILRLLKADCTVAFASGRGRSLADELRKWIPSALWSEVQLGIYNGAIRMALSDEVPEIAPPTPVMSALAERVGALPFADLLEVTVRSVQVSISLRDQAFAAKRRLAALIRDLVAQPPELALKVVESGHSVDVVEAETSKASVIDAIQRDGPEVLAVGDQGDAGGNDFELLAHDRWSLTVDRCSADPSRCWYVDPDGRGGPAALTRYLRLLDEVPGGLKIKLPRVDQGGSGA